MNETSIKISTNIFPWSYCLSIFVGHNWFEGTFRKSQAVRSNNEVFERFLLKPFLKSRLEKQSQVSSISHPSKMGHLTRNINHGDGAKYWRKYDNKFGQPEFQFSGYVLLYTLFGFKLGTLMALVFWFICFLFTAIIFISTCQRH